MTTLPDFRRGDTFEYSFTLTNSWVGSDFTGGFVFTLRESYPASSVTTDADAVYQASVASGEIVFVGAVGTITITDANTATWPAKKLYWDIQGKVTGGPKHTPDSGEIKILPDITRS